MKNQWLFSPTLPLIFFVLFILQFPIFGQVPCIQSDDTICVGECRPVSYNGPNTDMASYNWTISCGTITNPNLKNPHEACFMQAGNCTIQLITQEPGSAPDTCIKSVFVRTLPTARFVLRTDSVCLGNCLGLRIDFTGTPPYIFIVRDSFGGITTYRSPTNSKTISVCPTVSGPFAIVQVQDANCTNNTIQSVVRLKVFPSFKAIIFQEFSRLCTSPPVLNYKWFECNTINLVGTNSCFTPPREDCYCAVLFNGFCYDTVCATFKCNLTCGIDFSKPTYLGEKRIIRYKGNAGPNKKLKWTYTLDNINFITSNADSLELQFGKLGCYPISLEVKEEICTSTCTDTICVSTRPCACSDYNKNQVNQISTINNSCCYKINGEIASDKCFTSMKVLTNAGSFNNVIANSNGGWTTQNILAQSFSLSHQSGAFPTGAFQSGTFCVKDASNYTITVYYYFDNAGKKDSCKYQYVFNCNLTPQGPKCDSISTFLELQHTSPPSCCYLIRTSNSNSNYFNKILVTLNSGSFTNVNPSLGYNFITSTSQSFSLNHNSGFIPTGAITPATFCLNGITNPVTVTVYYIRIAAFGNDTCKSTFRFNCPDDGTPQPNCCDSTKAQLISYGNQNLCCWDLFSYSTKAKCFSKICISGSSGTFNNVVANAGWTASSTNNGICFTPIGNIVPTGNVNPGHFCVSNFTSPITFSINYYDNSGLLVPDCKQTFTKVCKDPPPCNCDNLDNEISGNSIQPGLCCYSFIGIIPFGGCYTKIGVTVSSGSFSNIVSALGYTATVNSSSSFTITHTSGHLPIGNISPATFCVIGATLYTITMQYFYIDQNGIEQRCVFPQVFECPKIVPKCSCDSLTTEINQLSSNPGVCCHNFTSHIGTSNCFTKIAVSVNLGSFVNIQPAINYTVSNQNNNSFNLTHISGHIPSGNITPANFCVTGATIYTITIQYFYIDQNGIEQRCIKTELFDCPKPVANCNCDSLTTTINNLNNNPGLCCYNFTSNVKSANCFTKISVSVNSGTFVNTLAAIGYTIGNQSNNSFSLTHSSGHIPSGNIAPANFCVSGATVYTITIQYYYLDQNGIELRCIKSATFDCPPPNQACSCDSIKTNITQTSTNPGICCHAIQSFIPKPNCMFAMSVQISAGTLSNVIPATNFTIGNLTNTHFNVGHTSGFLPQGNSQPVSFCVSGATIYSITIKYFYFNVGKLDSCVFSKSFDCPALDTSKLCDHGLCLGARAWQNISSFPGIVYDMKTYKCKLFAAGQFTTFANQSINNIAQWNGSNWMPLSSGVNGIVRTLAVHNGLLYVGGQFTMAGNVAVNNLAAWDGSNWFDVGAGVTNTNPAPAVLALLSTSNGLVVAGQFGQLGNNTIVNNIAMWNGSWTTPYGQGLPYPINMLNVYMNDLYAGGAFFNAPYNNISRWNGSIWNALSPNGITLINNVLYNGVNSSYVWNSELLVGGHFRKAENVSNTQHIVRWNGANWLSMIEGDVQDSIAAINDFIKYNGELFVGGEYNQIGNTSAFGVARSSNSNWFNVGHNNKLCKALETYNACDSISCDLYSAGEGFVSRWVCVTSTLNSDRAINWNIYPNPANNEITVDLKESGFKNFLLVIKNLQGQVVYSKAYIQETEIQTDISRLSEGIYFLEVVDSKKGSAQKKFVKSR